ncbi:hypothetical protein BLOT_011369 [Blomia tropicalis]|nr:hypothetical protein BLOT_011369 [Blomia tropicalis]
MTIQCVLKRKPKKDAIRGKNKKPSHSVINSSPPSPITSTIKTDLNQSTGTPNKKTIPVSNSQVQTTTQPTSIAKQTIPETSITQRDNAEAYMKEMLYRKKVRSVSGYYGRKPRNDEVYTPEIKIGSDIH